MLILAMDTATPQVGVAIGGHEGVRASITARGDRRHAELLAPMIEGACRAAGVTLDELGAIAVDVGPGLFTGLRVGIATAKSIAFGLGVPMIGVTSLDLLAFSVRYSNRLIVAAVDARRGEVFHAGYRQVPGGVQQLSEPQTSTPDDLRAQLIAGDDEILVIGDGARRHRDALEGVSRCTIGDARFAYPSPSALVELAHSKALREEFVPHWEVGPIYLRKPDAEINWQTRDSTS